MKTPFLLLLLLLSTLTGTVLCQSEGGEENEDVETEQDDQTEGVDDTETTESTPTDPDSTSAPTPSDDQGTEDTNPEEHGSGQDSPHSFDADSPASSTEPTVDFSSTVPDGTGSPEDDDSLSPIIILIPVVLVVVIIGMIVCGIFINRKWNKKARNQELGKEDPYLDGSSTEKVPMPMFEEDVPSVLELEMEELDQWMKKDG